MHSTQLEMEEHGEVIRGWYRHTTNVIPELRAAGGFTKGGVYNRLRSTSNNDLEN